MRRHAAAAGIGERGLTVSGPVQAVLVDFNTQGAPGPGLGAARDPTPFQQRIVQALSDFAQAPGAGGGREFGLSALRICCSSAVLRRAIDGAVKRAQRRIRHARGGYMQAQAQIAAARLDLDPQCYPLADRWCCSRSPGERGSAVASSLQAATLFVIAQDLSRLQAKHHGG